MTRSLKMRNFSSWVVLTVLGRGLEIVIDMIADGIAEAGLGDAEF